MNPYGMKYMVCQKNKVPKFGHYGRRKCHTKERVGLE